MSKVLINNSTLMNIADSIRAQLNSNESMKPSDMPGFINQIDTEKVTIDDYKVTGNLDLYSFWKQIVLDIETPPTTTTVPSGYSYKGKLYDGSKLYMKTTLTTVKDGSSSSSAGCTGTVLLIKPDGTQLSVAIPTYTIPSRSETGSSPDLYIYGCYLTFSPDGNIYLRLQRKFENNTNSSTVHVTYYQSIYKLNISSSSLSWTNKVIEVTLGINMYEGSQYIIEDNYIYVAGSSASDSFTRYIYGYKYGDTSYKLQKVSTNSIRQNSVGNNSTIFVRKNTNTYIYFFGPYSNHTLCDKWIAVTRNSDDTYTESEGTASLSKYNKSWNYFMLNGEAYVQMLGHGGNSGYEGFHIYKLNSDNSAWEVVYNIENATTYNTEVTGYLNNTPDIIFQGSDSGDDFAIRSNGTFELIEFSPGTIYHSRIPTPTITIGDYETWYYHSYKYNSIGQKIFFFQVESSDTYYDNTQYKCVLEAVDGGPVLYSTFRESDIIG